jgi:hypothetical protein
MRGATDLAFTFGFHDGAVDVTAEPGFTLPAHPVLSAQGCILERIDHDLRKHMRAVLVMEHLAGCGHGCGAKNPVCGVIVGRRGRLRGRDRP